MKKLIKKKVNVFGKSIPVLLIAMVAVLGVTSAALVPYLSNTVSGEVGVISPFEVTMEEELANIDSTNFADGNLEFNELYGGQTIKATVKFQHLATLENNEKATVIEKFVISGEDPEGSGIQEFSCDDFAKIEFRSCQSGSTGYCETFPDEWTDVTELCSEVEDGTIIIEEQNEYASLETNIDQFKLTLKTNAIGAYTLSAEVIPTQ